MEIGLQSIRLRRDKRSHENKELNTELNTANGLKIQGFREDGKPCYEGKSSTGHIWWDACNCIDCQEEETFVCFKF